MYAGNQYGRPLYGQSRPPQSGPPYIGPICTVSPVAAGTTVVGDTLSTTDGTWTGTAPITFTYRWQRDGHGDLAYVDIGGATASTYTLVEADDGCNVRCVVTGRNLIPADAASNALGPVTEPAPVNTAPPVVTGYLYVLFPLTTNDGTWLNMGGYSRSYAYQWQRSATGIGAWFDIGGATGAVFLPTPYGGYEDDYLRVIVTATNSGGSSSAASAAVGPIKQAARRRDPSIILGCGVYQTFVFERGGRVMIGLLDWDALEFERVLNDTSEAQISGAVGSESECCALLAQVRPWRHELVIRRDGVTVWAGPIYRVRIPPGSYTIQARDLSAWWDRRMIHSDLDYTNDDLATIFQGIADDAMAVENGAGLTVRTTPSGVATSRKYLDLQHRMAGPELRDLSSAGIDWTAVGREIRAGGLIVPTSPLGPFMDEHFAEPPTPVLDGSVQANLRVVRGQGGGDGPDTIYATAEDSAAVDADGLLEYVDTISTITTVGSAMQTVTGLLKLTASAVTAEDCRLLPTAPFPLASLVPGARCQVDLRHTCIPVIGTYRLQTVRVTAASNGDDSVAVDFQPEGVDE